MTEAVFAIPGDMHRRTGGFIYEATVLKALNTIGCKTEHLQLPDSFPDPNAADMRDAVQALCHVPPDQVIILDGFIAGGIDPAALATVPARLIAMIHHPLGLETGLSPDRAAFLLKNEAAALRQVDHVIVPSPHTARILADDLGVPVDKITIAQPGFTRPDTSKQRLRDTVAEPPMILSVGLLAARKGHDILLEALARITDLTWHARIVGKPHMADIAQQLAAQCDRLGLSQRVDFCGELDEIALQDQFSAASVFALATRYEGYGMVFGEAMLWGLPIVSCHTGAVPDTVRGAGLLVPPGDALAFAAALRRILQETDIRENLSAISAAQAVRLPQWTDTAHKIAQAIRQIAAS